MTTLTIPDLPASVKQYLVDNFERYKVYSNRASLLGHPCERFLTYKRTRWQEEARPDDGLLSVFAEGAIHEDAVIRLLGSTGYRIIAQQTAFEWPEHQISGRIDGQLIVGDGRGEGIPIDVKSMSPYSWNEIRDHDPTSVRDHQHHYVRGYYDQMVLYEIMGNKEQGILIFKNKVTGLLKQVEIALDYARAEELVQKADRVNAHVAAGTLPDRIPYEQDICGRCSFFHICLPDEALSAGLSLVDDPELEGKIRRRAELEDAHKEYERIDKDVKKQVEAAMLEDGEGVVGNDWLVRVTTRNRKGYTVDASSYREVKIIKVGKTPTRDDA
jgi:CRISPR/Cas system-associated exonuclease Cas4 (RecB family)